MTDRILIRGGIALTQDPALGEMPEADVSNVKTVFVDGEALKEDFKLKASLDAPRRAVEGSRDYLLEKFGEPEPGWLTAAR